MYPSVSKTKLKPAIKGYSPARDLGNNCNLDPRGRVFRELSTPRINLSKILHKSPQKNINIHLYIFYS